MKSTRSKRYLFIGLGIVLLAVALWLLNPLYRSYYLNIYYPADDRLLAVFNADNPGSDLQPGSVVAYKAVWRNNALWSDKGDIENELAKHNVMLTVETWLSGVNYNTDVLTELKKGKFDDQIRELASIIVKAPHQAYIRWNPDMEVPTNFYPWQYQSPASYITAFNYFAKKLKQYAPNAKVVWSPSGYPGDTEYWPGNKYADYVSITLGSPSEYSLNYFPMVKTPQEMMRQKLHRLRFIKKPVLIVDVWNITKGAFNASWLAEEKAYINKYRQTVYSDSNYADSCKTKPIRKVLQVGVFDPNKRLLNQKAISVEHLFTDLGQVERGEFEKSFLEVTGRHHDVIVTMEPWKDVAHKADTLTLERILNGTFDSQIKKLFSIISATNQTVYLRWMHEMEIPIHRYAWQSQDPVTYIDAYRYFMQFNGGPGKNVKKVWGPAGDRGSADFWPGSDVVDYISIAIYGLPDKNITDQDKQEAFNNIFSRKYFRMRFLDKPLFITEFGVKGSEDFQDKWLADAAKTINANPHVFGVCYFNLYDNPKAWGSIKAPDWSMTPKSMSKFCSLLKQ